MSWLSTVSTVRRRAKEGILQAVGAHQATEDLEFDLKLKNFNDHVNDLNKVKDALELWIESFDTFSAATLMLSNIFHSFFSENPYDNDTKNTSSYHKSSENLKEAVEKLNNTVVLSVRQLFIERCLQPANAMLAMIHPINVQLSERKQLMLDFDSYRAKIQLHHESGRDSIHPKVIKTAMKLDESAKKLYALQLNILASFNEYEKVRDLTFGPEFCSFLACFYHFSSFSADLSGRIIPTVPQTASSLYILESHVPQDFLELNSLPVVIDDLDSDCKPDPLYPNLVLQRSEYAGGSYGGYAGYSVVLPETEVYEPQLLGLPTATTNHVNDELTAIPDNDNVEDDVAECNKDNNHLPTIESSIVSNDSIELHELNNISQTTNELSNIESNSFSFDVSSKNNSSDPITIIENSTVPSDLKLAHINNDSSVSYITTVIDPPSKPPKSTKPVFSGNKIKGDIDIEKENICLVVTDSNSTTNVDNTLPPTAPVEINSDDNIPTESSTTEVVIIDNVNKCDNEVTTIITPIDAVVASQHILENEGEVEDTVVVSRCNVKITPVKPPKIYKTISKSISPTPISLEKTPSISSSTSDGIQPLNTLENICATNTNDDNEVVVAEDLSQENDQAILNNDSEETDIPEPPPPPPPPTCDPPFVEIVSEVIISATANEEEDYNITTIPTNTIIDNSTIPVLGTDNEYSNTNKIEIDDSSNSSKLIPPKKPPKNIIPAKK